MLRLGRLVFAKGNFKLVAVLFVLGLTYLSALAESVSGTVRRVTDNGIELDNGIAYKKSSSVEVRLANAAQGEWGDIKVGDYVELTTNSQRLVSKVGIGLPPSTAPVEISVSELKPVTGELQQQNDKTISGRLFPFALCATVGTTAFMDRRSVCTYPVPEGCSVFQGWLGACDGPRDNGSFRISVKIDDETVFTSGIVEYGQRAELVSVDVSGRRSITFSIESTGGKESNITAMLGDPKFIKTPLGLPKLISPLPGETLTSPASLVWRSVEGAKGYLLELQCYKVANEGDETNPKRFQSLLFLPETTSSSFDPKSMPVGKWRWRVHALGKRGFIGEAKGWQLFSTK